MNTVQTGCKFLIYTWNYSANLTPRLSREYYTGVGITFSREISDAKLFDSLESASSTAFYLQDCKLNIHIAERSTLSGKG